MHPTSQRADAHRDTWPIIAIAGTTDLPTHRWAAGLNDPTAGTVAVSVRPLPGNHDQALAHDLTRAAGRDPQPHCPRRDPGPTLADALAWVAGHQPEDLVIHHAQWLTAAQTITLTDHASATTCRLWLIYDPYPTRPQLTALRHHLDPTNLHPIADLRALWTTRPRRTPPAPTPTPAPTTAHRQDLPALPDTDPLLLHAAISRQRNPTDARTAHAHLHAATRRAHTELAATLSNHPALHYNATSNHRLLKSHILDLITTPDLPIAYAIASTQLALIAHGWHLTVPNNARTTQLRDAHNTSAPHSADDIAGQLRHDHSPIAATASALVADNISDATLLTLTLEDTTAAGNIRNRPPLSATSRYYIRARQHQLRGLPGSTPLLLDDQPAPAPRLVKQAHHHAHQHKIAYGRHVHLGHHPDDNHAFRTLALELHRLPGGPPNLQAKQRTANKQHSSLPPGQRLDPDTVAAALHRYARRPSKDADIQTGTRRLRDSGWLTGSRLHPDLRIGITELARSTG